MVTGDDRFDFFKDRTFPYNRIEQWLFWDYTYSPNDLCDMWGISKSELDSILKNPYNKLTPRYIEDIASLVERARIDILIEAIKPDRRSIKTEEEFRKWIQLKNRG